jgi:16S rRNA (cytidine1402-2'-O)-methyltransferase
MESTVVSINSYAAALAGANATASSQHYPRGALYVVATPIGNLADISLRALHVLSLAETIACEDTRHSQAMLRAYGIDKSSSQLLGVHQHNEAEASTVAIERLREGQRVAYVSDAGTPGVSDPGARLVAAARAQGFPVVPVPGPSSVTALLSVAGVSTDAADTMGFLFAGFLPVKATQRAAFVESLKAELRCVVVLEAPHRIESAALALAALGDRALTIGREMTKQFEEIATLPASELTAWLAINPNRLRGEFALVIHPAPEWVVAKTDQKVLSLLLAELPLKTAVRLAAEITGESRNDLYAAALALRNSDA